MSDAASSDLAFHVQLYGSLTRTAWRLNLDQAELRELLDRRALGGEFWSDGKRFVWAETEIRIYRAPYVTQGPDYLANTVAIPIIGENVTDSYVNGPPGTAVASASSAPHKDPRAVGVVHGRDSEAKAALFDFLRSLSLLPLEWEHLVASTGSAAPYIGAVVDELFIQAQAVVVLFTPDDVVHLHPDLTSDRRETVATAQPRANVLLEAGYALGSHPTQTVFVEVGEMRQASDLAGRHVIRLTSEQALNALATRLQTAGCPVDKSGGDWTSLQRFSKLSAHRRSAHDPSGRP